MYRKHVGRALILALMLSGATSMNAQRITRQFKNVPLKTVLAEVEKELQYSIIYKKDEVNERKQITRDFKDASLEEVLSAVLDNGLCRPGQDDCDFQEGSRRIIYHSAKADHCERHRER